MTDPPSHLWRDKVNALSGPLSGSEKRAPPRRHRRGGAFGVDPSEIRSPREGIHGSDVGCDPIERIVQGLLDLKVIPF